MSSRFTLTLLIVASLTVLACARYPDYVTVEEVVRDQAKPSDDDDADQGEPELLVEGDPAPALSVDSWLRGPDQVTELSNDHIYIVEQWATWCGPCRKGMPSLEALAERFAIANVHVLMISTEPEDVVRDFIEVDGIGYQHLTFGVDGDGSMLSDWFERTGANGIPRQVVVDRSGDVVARGHFSPQSLLGVARTVAKEDRAAGELAAFFDEVEALRSEASSAHDRGDMLEYIDVVRTLEGLDAVTASELAGVAEAHFALGEVRAGYLAASRLETMVASDGHALNGLAWFIVDDASLPYRDLDLALALSERSNDALGYKDAPSLDTLARVHWLRGDADAARRFQTDALAACHTETWCDPGPYEAHLREYEAE